MKKQVVLKSELKRKFPGQEEAIQKAIDYCEMGKYILEIDNGVYEIKSNRGKYTFYEVKREICLINKSFRASELCKKWNGVYHKAIIHVAINTLVKEGVLFYNERLVNYKVKRKV